MSESRIQIEASVFVKAAIFTTEFTEVTEKTRKMGEGVGPVKSVEKLIDHSTAIPGLNHRVSRGKTYPLHLASPGWRRISLKSADRALQSGIEMHFNPES
jgi:hypothetical protein